MDSICIQMLFSNDGFGSDTLRLETVLRGSGRVRIRGASEFEALVLGDSRGRATSSGSLIVSIAESKRFPNEDFASTGAPARPNCTGYGR